MRQIPILTIFAVIIFTSLPARAWNESYTDSWFSSEKVADRTWKISDNGNDNIYLIEGSSRAMVIDTGLGRSDLAAYVKTLTKLPLIVINTHGHPDHSGGNYRFDGVSAHPDDFSAIRNYMHSANPMNGPRLTAIKDGDRIDLGGRVLEVIGTPGHTAGSICLLDVKTKAVFTGDTSNGLVWLFLRECTPLETYLQSLITLRKRTATATTIMPGHGDPMDISFFGELIACTEHILKGDSGSEPYSTFAGNAMLYRYKRAGVAYNPGNLRGGK